MQPLTILTIAALPFPTHQGTQVLIGAIAEALAHRGHRVHLLCYTHGAFEPSGAYTIHRVGDFPPVRSLRSGPSAGKVALDLRLALHARALARALAPDVIHAHGHEAILATGLPPRISRPIVYHAHTLMGPELPTYFASPGARALVRPIGAALDWLAPRLADAGAAVSRELASVNRAGHVPAALEVPAPIAPAPDGPRVVYAGNLDGYQGLDALLDAIARVPRAELVVVTASSPCPLARRATRAGIADRIRFVRHGSIEEVRQVLARAAVVAVPRGIPTGFPIKLLEALAADIPVVVSRRAADGLVDREQARVVDDDQMADAIAEILAQPSLARAMAARGRRFVLAEHDPSLAAARLEEIFQSAMRARKT